MSSAKYPRPLFLTLWYSTLFVAGSLLIVLLTYVAIVGVICAVAVGVVFALLTEFLRGHTDVGARVRASVHPVDAKQKRGAMETLMANGRQGETK